MATSKKGAKKAPKKAKARASKKSRPKAAPKKKAGAVKRIKKAPAKAKAKAAKKARSKALPKKKGSAAKKAMAKPKPKAVKKARPKAAVKNKSKAAPKPKEAPPITAPGNKITKTRAVAPATRATRGEAVVSQTTLDRLYIVNDSGDNVTLEVRAGDKGQTSDMTIQLDDTIIAEELAGDFNERVIGTNSGLAGKKLSIVATIADTSRETNLTSLTIILKGGLSAGTFPLSKEVSQEGESVDYLALIEFFRPD
jgi:hypothetical protein